MNLRKGALRAIDRFLVLVPARTRKRGRGYFVDGHVLELECLEPNQHYAAVVRGSEDYEVSLNYNDGSWSTDCSCPIGYECKHIVAAMLDLKSRATAENGATIVPLRPPRRSRGVPQPPCSALSTRLVNHLGRELDLPEAEFVRKTQALYSQAGFRSLTPNDLAMFGCKGMSYSWQPLELWPTAPPDDFYFWLYLAWELRRRGVSYPEFMAGITDLGLIETAMTDWEREKQIAHWNAWFRQFHDSAGVSDSLTLELRLLVGAEEARLQWRTAPAAGFIEMKQAHAKKFAEQFEHGALNLTPDSLPLWSAAFKPWSYNSWWSFKYTDSSARPALNRLLRMPLARATAPLRLLLRPPENGNGDYELRLVTADGSAPPPIICNFSGQPSLYLTATTLFAGPAPNALQMELRKTIPAPALESVDGLRFLHATGVTLPDRLAERIRTLPVTVALSCELKPAYFGSQTEETFISVVAKAPGLDAEKFTSRGWERTANQAKPRSPAGVLSVYDRRAQKHFPHVLEILGVKPNYADAWTFRPTKKNIEQFVSWLQSLPPEIEVRLDRQLATLRDEPLRGALSLEVEESAMDWFDVKVVLGLSDTTLTPEELKLLLNARGGYVRLGRKGWRRLQFNLSPEDDEQLARLGLDARDFTTEPQRFHALQLAAPGAKKFLAPECVEKIQRRAEELKTRVTPGLPAEIRAELRPYQTEGFHFLAYLAANRFGGVLADDMGLGKTLQALAWLAWLRDGAQPPEKGGRKAPAASPALVVCPKSVTDNWRGEAERFYPGLRVQVWRGEPAEELSAAREQTDLLVINYAQLRALSPAIAQVPWSAAILDEAQCIKNPESQTAQASRALKAEHRLALTGTPIENRLLDLWSIFGFAMPAALGNRAHFLRRFNAQDDPLARRRLAARVRPFLLRRTKAQVAKDLPDRVEEDLLCEMEGQQRTLYRAELKRARQLVLGLTSNQQLNQERFNVLTSLLRLRQICCHPALVDEKLREAESAKMAALEDLLEPLMAEGHKVLVFSQFVTMLDLLREQVKPRGWNHFYLAGDTENRGELVQEFQSASGGAVFLISLKAGGFGLNLTAASYVVLFDPWWNPAVENQAIDRTHRIGQVSKVMAYRLLMRDSIEQKIRALQKRKTALIEDVLGEERFAQSLTLEDLRFLFAE